MSRQELVNQIAQALGNLGVPYQIGGLSDIMITAQFLDAGWSTGKKEIRYEALILADEAQKTVFMWEMTKELSSGFSLGAEGASSFQMGKTLFRKVKSIQYGPEGKVHEISLDLGAIPRAVKQAAQAQGWKFKTVLNKQKASYPQGVSAAPASGAASSPGQVFCHECGSRIPEQAQFCPECGTRLQVAPVPTQPAYSPAACPESLDSAPKPKSKKALLLILSGGFLVLMLLLGITAVLRQDGAPTQNLAARLQNPRMTSGIGPDGRPVDNVNTYKTTAPQLVAAVELRSAPPNTKVRFKWIYASSNQPITEFVTTNANKGSDIYVFSLLTNRGPWPVGDYRGELYLDDKSAPDASITFKVLP